MNVNSVIWNITWLGNVSWVKKIKLKLSLYFEMVIKNLIIKLIFKMQRMEICMLEFNKWFI